MWTQRGAVVWVAVAVCLFSVRAAAGGIDVPHMRFVEADIATGHYLFRTGIPNNNSGVDVDLLHKTFTELAKAQGLPFYKERSDYYLVDISFLSYKLIDDHARNLEYKFFKRHPEIGAYINWPVGGAAAHGELFGSYSFNDACEKKAKIGWLTCQLKCFSRQPSAFKSKDRIKMASTMPQWDGDHLNERLSYVHQILHTKVSQLPDFRTVNKPLVIFGHCTCGCDRTGEFFGAYMLRYLKVKGLEEVYKFSYNVPERPLVYPNQVAIQWYCEYLHNLDPVRWPYTDCSLCDKKDKQKPRCSCLPSFDFAPESLWC